jgi:hypothetical protein
MEWVSSLAGERHSDAPLCVSPVVRRFCTTLNDALDDVARQRILPYLARTIGTAGDGLDERRSWMALDWLIRVYAPTWLAAAHLPHSADALRSLPAVLDTAGLGIATRALRGARVQARRAWSRTLGPSRVVAWVPRTGERSTARQAARRSVGAPAWVAAAVEVRTRACDRASAICRELAGDAASTLIRTERAGGCGSAPYEMAPAALVRTLELVLQSAFGLLERMLPAIPIATQNRVGSRTATLSAPPAADTMLAAATGATSR